MKPLIIGIAGGTGSGKTTLVNRLLEQFGEDISVLPHDSYYAAHHELTLEERQALNYDHPASFDTHRMIQDLRDLKAGKAVQCPVYDYTIYDRTDETVTLSPNKVILVEGILIFENKELRDLLDIKIFVDTDADVRILRRLTRDVKDRGRIWTRWWSSTCPPSSPCTTSSWNPPSGTPTSSSPRGARIWWP